MKRIAGLAAVLVILGAVIFVGRPTDPKDDAFEDLLAAPVVSPAQTVVPTSGRDDDTDVPDLGDVLADDTGVTIDEGIPQIDGIGDFDGRSDGDPDFWPDPDPLSALEFATGYYTLNSTTPMHDHRTALGSWTTAAYADDVLLNDPDGLFARSDGVRAAFGEDSLGNVRQHNIVRVGNGIADIAVVIDVLVTADGQERMDSHLMIVTLIEPTTDNGRWLVSDVVINPEPGTHEYGDIEFPIDS